MIGIYGVMSYLVTQRTREFGIRLALGATRTDVVRSVLRHGAILIAFGTILGVAATGGLYRLFQSLLFDPLQIEHLLARQKATTPADVSQCAHEDDLYP